MLGASSLVNADIVQLPLDCPSHYDFNSPYWTADFDLGVTFSEISHVYIDWAGEITGGLAILYDNPSEPFPIDVGVYASLGSNPFLLRTTVWGGEATSPDPKPFDLQSEFELVGGSTWSDLLDGQGSIVIGYTEVVLQDGLYVQSGSVLLSGATLVVDATIVPEPCTLVLVVLGGLISRKHLHKTGNYNIRLSALTTHQTSKGG